MTFTLFLARHATHDEVGRVLSGRSEIALNAEGRAQAAALATLLASTGLSAIHSSPRRRAFETAATVGERHDLPVATSDDLDEIDFGAWTGRSFEALDGESDWRTWNAQRASAATPAGDTMSKVVERALRHFRAIAERSSGPVLCVSHCDTIRGVVAATIGLPLDAIFSFDVAPASLTTLAYDEGRIRLVALNQSIPPAVAS